jgi:hypothetical protein
MEDEKSKGEGQQILHEYIHGKKANQMIPKDENDQRNAIITGVVDAGSQQEQRPVPPQTRQREKGESDKKNDEDMRCCKHGNPAHVLKREGGLDNPDEHEDRNEDVEVEFSQSREIDLEFPVKSEASKDQDKNGKNDVKEDLEKHHGQ